MSAQTDHDRKEDQMDVKSLTDEEILLASRALSIHRVSLRRKIGRLSRGSPERQEALIELNETTVLLDKLNQADWTRIA
jgi:hypothetical protein